MSVLFLFLVLCSIFPLLFLLLLLIVSLSNFFSSGIIAPMDILTLLVNVVCPCNLELVLFAKPLLEENPIEVLGE